MTERALARVLNTEQTGPTSSGPKTALAAILKLRSGLVRWGCLEINPPKKIHLVTKFDNLPKGWDGNEGRIKSARRQSSLSLPSSPLPHPSQPSMRDPTWSKGRWERKHAGHWLRKLQDRSSLSPSPPSRRLRVMAFNQRQVFNWVSVDAAAFVAGCPMTSVCLRQTPLSRVSDCLVHFHYKTQIVPLVSCQWWKFSLRKMFYWSMTWWHWIWLRSLAGQQVYLSHAQLSSKEARCYQDVTTSATFSHKLPVMFEVWRTICSDEVMLPN